ncbi:MAG: efflux transporter outer membrane subunit [Pseudomonadota bacterium]
MNIRNALMATVVLMTGCTTLGPNFVPPSTTTPTAYRHASTTEQAAVQTQWWKSFGDNTLNQLEEMALRENFSAKAAAQRLVRAQAQLLGARANRLPSLSVGTSASTFRSSQNTSDAIASGGQSIKGDRYEGSASLSYELDIWGKVRRAVEAADAQALAAGYDYEGVLLLLSSQVATTYWQLRGLDAEIAILEQALGSRRETLQMIEARFKAGFTGEFDVWRSHVETANAETDLHDAVRRRNLLEHALATLTGASPSVALVQAMNVSPDAALPEPPVIPSGLPANLLRQRPDLAQSVEMLRAANAQIGVAEAAFYPSIQLTSNFGYASESLRNLTENGSRQFSVGPLSLTLPIFDGGRNRANLEIARAQYDEAVANHSDRLLTALREVEDALSDAEQRQKQSTAQAQARNAAVKAYAVAQRRYERGLSNYLDVADAQRSSLSTDRMAIQIRTQRLLDAVAVARALGGGFQIDRDSL